MGFLPTAANVGKERPPTRNICIVRCPVGVPTGYMFSWQGYGQATHEHISRKNVIIYGRDISQYATYHICCADKGLYHLWSIKQCVHISRKTIKLQEPGMLLTIRLTVKYKHFDIRTHTLFYYINGVFERLYISYQSFLCFLAKRPLAHKLLKNNLFPLEILRPLAEALISWCKVSGRHKSAFLGILNGQPR